MKYQSVLLIDDDEDDQEIFLSAISQISTSLHCIAVSDATDALQKLFSNSLRPDIIFLDLNMPVMNGQQFLTEIKKHQTLKGIPVFMFSTTSHSAAIQQAEQLGASGFITKPGNYDELVNLLSAVISK